MKKIAVIISPNYKDYAKKYLDDCLLSLKKQDYQGEMKIFITDNESNDESLEFLEKTFVQAGYQVIGERNYEISNLDSRFRGNDKEKQGGNSQKRINVEIIRNENNDGFAKGNNDAMKLAIKQGFDYIILFNMDTVVESDCVAELAKVAESDEKIGAAQARLMLWPEKEKVNSLGNAAHFLGFGYCIGYGLRCDSIEFAQIQGLRKQQIYAMQNGSTAPAAVKNDSEGKQPFFAASVNSSDNGRRLWSQRENCELRINDIFYPSGAAALFKREILEKIGLFDEEFWMYNEDQDLGWRIWLAGWKCVLAPDAVVYHKYQFARSIRQYYWMDRNRIIVMIKNYHFLTLLLILPPFVIMELGLILFSLKTGWFKEKMKVWRYFFTPAKWQYLYKARRQTQALRKVKDRDIIDMISGRIWYQEVDDVKLRLINPVFNIYWKAVKLLVKIFNF